MKPLNYKIQLRVERLTQTKSGIELTGNTLIIEEAEVLAIGSRVTTIKKGDNVLFKSWALDNVTIGDEIYSFIEEKNILAIK